MNITQQSEAFLNQLETRRTRKAKPRTLAAYTSYAQTWIVRFWETNRSKGLGTPQ